MSSLSSTTNVTFKIRPKTCSALEGFRLRNVHDRFAAIQLLANQPLAPNVPDWKLRQMDRPTSAAKIGHRVLHSHPLALLLTAESRSAEQAGNTSDQAHLQQPFTGIWYQA